jgi:F0F1-type ATP synthase assembly protein I
MNQKNPGEGHEETRLARRVKTLSQVTAGAMIPSMILVGIVGGYLLGAWIQGRAGGEPWWGVGFAVLGGVASVRKIVQMVRAESLSKKDDPSRGNDPQS